MLHRLVSSSDTLHRHKCRLDLSLISKIPTYLSRASFLYAEGYAYKYMVMLCPLTSLYCWHVHISAELCFNEITSAHAYLNTIFNRAKIQHIVLRLTYMHIFKRILFRRIPYFCIYNKRYSQPHERHGAVQPEQIQDISNAHPDKAATYMYRLRVFWLVLVCL